MGQTNRGMGASKAAAQDLAFENGREAVFLFQPCLVALTSYEVSMYTVIAMHGSVVLVHHGLGE
jgi:hypothetical protein